MRILNGGFICLFLLMLVLPLVFVDFSTDRVSVLENRKLADRPNLADIKTHPVKFIRDFDAWFKDSTGFREKLLALYNAMEMNTMSGVRYGNVQAVYLVGEYGHHFYAGQNGFMIRRFQGEPILSDGQLADMANKLEKIKVYLEGKNIPFIVMFCPDKESVYPEFYPKSIKRGPEPIQMDLVTNYLRENAGVDVVNVRQALLAEKNNYLLFNVSSGDLGHYTEIGAFFAYRELMKHINKYFPKIMPYELDDIEINYDKNGVPDVSMKKKTYKTLDPAFFDDVDLGRPFTWENIIYENIDPDLPVIMVFRDSSSGGLFVSGYEIKLITQFIASQFYRAIFIHYSNLKNFNEYVAKFKPDIIVFEATERQIDILAKEANEIPDPAIMQSRY